MSSVVYIVHWEDRHTDDVIEVWLDEHKAILRGREIFESYNYVPDPEDNEVDLDGTWLYFSLCSIEGDSVRVLRGLTNG